MDSFIDRRDGQSYKLIRIGSQVWMKENLRFKTVNSLSPNQNDKIVSSYGRLYTHYESKKIIPSGWRLPSQEDLWQLLYYVTKTNERSYTVEFHEKLAYAELLRLGFFSPNFLSGRFYKLIGYDGLNQYSYFWLDTMYENYAMSIDSISKSVADTSSNYSNHFFSVRCIL